VTIAAVGDTMLGSTPDLPPHPGTYLAAVKRELTRDAQIVFGNLEGTPHDGDSQQMRGNARPAWGLLLGQIKSCMKMTAMSRRGFSACHSEWLLAATAHNLRKLHAHHRSA
jgi:hypothetical protein